MTFAEAKKWVRERVSMTARHNLKEALSEGAFLDNLAGMQHHGFGTHLRNTLHLWDDSSADLKEEVWNSLTPEKQKYYANWWKGKGDYQGRTMFADDCSHEIILAALQELCQ